MTVKLKQGFFKVFPYNPYIPLQGDWFIIEDDANFSVMHDQAVATTYSAFSHGCGKVRSVFNTEYFVFESGVGQVRVVDNDHIDTMIHTISASDLFSIVCMNDYIFEARLNGTTLTVSQYVIAGTKQQPFIDLVTSKTISVSAGYTGASACCVKNSTEAFVYQGKYTSSVGECVKLTVDGDDFELSLESDFIKNLIHADMVLEPNNQDFLYYKPVAYYSDCYAGYRGTGSGYTYTWTFSVYDTDDTLQYTYTIQRTNPVLTAQGAKVFLNQTDGSGYLVLFDAFNNGSNLPCGRFRVFSFGGGVATELYSQDTEQINVVAGASTQRGFYPWKGVFPGFGYGANQYISRKGLLTLSSCTLANAVNFTNTSTPMIFGNTIKWL